MATKRAITTIPIAPGNPVRVEDFRYVDQGLEWNMQNEYDLRDDHLQASRVINWEIFGEAAIGLSGWTPGDSLLLYVTANELFTTEGLAYIGGRSYVLSANAELFDGETPANNTYNIYLKYTLASDEFAYEYTTSDLDDTHLIKYLLLGTCQYTGGTGWIADPVDKRASNTALGAPATVSGADSGPIFTVENTGSGLGLLVRLSDAQIGEDGTPQILTIWGTSTTGLTLKESGTANTIILSCDAAGRMKVAGAINVTGTGTVIASSASVGGVTLNAGAISSVTTLDTSGAINGLSISAGTIDSGTWEGTDIAAAYLGTHSHDAADQGGDYAWADITGFGAGGSATTVSRSDHDHNTTYYTQSQLYPKSQQDEWPKRAEAYCWAAGDGGSLSNYFGFAGALLPSGDANAWISFNIKIPFDAPLTSTVNLKIQFINYAWSNKNITMFISAAKVGDSGINSYNVLDDWDSTFAYDGNSYEIQEKSVSISQSLLSQKDIVGVKITARTTESIDVYVVGAYLDYVGSDHGE